MKRIIITAALLLMIGCSSAPVKYANGEAPQPSAWQRFVAGVRASMTSGQTEVRLAYGAKQKATSFKMKAILRLHPGRALETVTEVSCPDQERFTGTIGEQSFHAVRLRDRGFVEQMDGKWTEQPTPAGTNWSPCGANPGEPAPWAMMNEGRELTTILAQIAKQNTVTRGDYVLTADGGGCQEWVVSVNHSGTKAKKGSGMSYTMCVGRDHLPRYITMGGGGLVVQYYDWNKPITISAPQA